MIILSLNRCSTGLSIERYGAFAAPPKHRTTANNRACVGNLVIWILGTVCGLPLAIFAYEESFFEIGPNNIENKHVVSIVYLRSPDRITYTYIYIIRRILHEYQISF